MRRPGGLLRLFAGGWLRRTVASALALAVLSFSLESLIADVHDGDAPAAVVVGDRSLPVHSPQVGTNPVARSGVAASGADSVSAAVVSSVNDGSSTAPGRAPSGAPSHAFHVCHGGHEHAAAAPDRPPPPRIASPRAVVCATYTLLPSTRGTEPPVRPPIA